LARMLESGKLATIAALALACVVYVLALLLLRALTRDDVEMLPGGEKLAGFLAKRNWIS